MNGNGKGPMDRGQGMGRKLGYCYGYKNANFKNENEEAISMNGNGRGPMNKGQGMGRKLGYCYGYKNTNFETKESVLSLGKRFVQGFRQDVEYTEKELLNLRKISLQGELEIIEEKLKNL